MFEYTILHWTTFFTAVFLLTISPGPDMAFILGQTLSNGRNGGFYAMFGIWTGAFTHVVMAAVGLSAIVATSAIAFSVVKWVGVLYLVWLGIHALRSGGELLTSKATDEATSQHPWPIYRQGVLVAALNPKVAIFFLAFLPQFVVVGAGPTWAQLFLHGVMVLVVAAMVEPLIVLLGSQLVRVLQNNRRAASWVDRGLGGLFITLGIRLALTRQ